MELPVHDVIKQGYLKFKGKNTVFTQRQWAVLKKASSKGGRRLERYPDEKSCVNNNPAGKSIDLQDVVSVQRLPADIKKYALAIAFSDTNKPTRTISCDSDEEADAWMAAIQLLCLSKELPPVSSIDLLECGPSQKELTEVFHVYLLPSLNLGYYGECMLQVTQENIHLLESHNPGKRLVSWPLNTLRRYGSDDTKFTFESGRFCGTGEGIFMIKTKEGEAIYKKVHAATQAIAEIHRLLHRENLSRGQSLPLPLDRPAPPAAPFRSLSSPEESSEGPEPPPRPTGLMQPVRQMNCSAVDLSLPPLPPGGPGIPFGDYLVCAEGGETYYDTDNPPTHMAPPPPAHYSRGQIPISAFREQEAYGGPLKDDGNYISIKRPQVPIAELIKQREQILKTGKTGQGLQAQGATGGAASGGHEEYLYVEKGLTAAFRSYLKERKQDG